MTEVTNQQPELNPLQLRLIAALDQRESGLGSQFTQAITEGTLPPDYDFDTDTDDSEVSDITGEKEFDVLCRVIADTLQKTGIEEPVLQPESPRIFKGYTYFKPTTEMVKYLMRVRGFNEYGQPEVENVGQPFVNPTTSTLIRLQAVTYRDASGGDTTMISPDETLKSRWDASQFPTVTSKILASGGEVGLINNAEYHAKDMEFVAVVQVDDPQEVEAYIQANLPDLLPVTWQDLDATKAFLAPLYHS